MENILHSNLIFGYYGLAKSNDLEAQLALDILSEITGLTHADIISVYESRL